jgi:hypothetical protein
MKLHKLINTPARESRRLFVEAVSSDPVSLLEMVTSAALLVENHDLIFENSAAAQNIPVPLKRLEGLDEIEVSAATLYCSSIAGEKNASAGPVSAAAEGQTLKLSGPTGPASLLRIEIINPMITPPAGQAYILAADAPGTPRSSVSWAFGDDSSTVNRSLDTAIGGAQQLHVLIRPMQGSAAGPPMAAAPYFAMPGNGSSMYGPALGAARLSITSAGAGSVKVTVLCEPPVSCNGCMLVIATNNATSANEGLPNESQGLAWTADNVSAVFDCRPGGMSIQLCSPADSSGALLASFDADPGNTPHEVSYAPVARAILKKAYPVSTGNDLGLTLSVKAKNAGAVRIGLGSFSARYLYRPADQGSISCSIRGDMPEMMLPMRSQLHPAAFAATLSGLYSPQRLTIASNLTPPQSAGSIRIAGSVWAGRPMTLSAIEKQFPLGRCAIYGRCDAECELLFSLHTGDALRIGKALADPVSLIISPSSVCAWQRFEFGASGYSAPHDDLYWMAVRASKGAFYWHCDTERQGQFLRSDDGGAHWTDATGCLLSQMTVIDIPEESQTRPTEPLTIGCKGAVLSADCTDVVLNGSSPVNFERSIAAEGPSYAPFFDAVASGNRTLNLIAACMRDCDITLSDIVFAYFP